MERETWFEPANSSLGVTPHYEVFIAAVLLTGSADRAERAVVEGIETLAGDDVSEHMVLQATIRAAFKRK